LRLACDASDIFAAFAPAAFDLLEENEEPCHPPRPVAVLAFRGTADPIVPYGGGASTPPNGLPITIHFLGAQGTFDKLGMLDGCTDAPAVAANGCNMRTQCSAGVEVGLCTKQGGGHDTGDANIAWPFLSKHPMP
jgi:polyhydroxybutyrate depolymerase